MRSKREEKRAQMSEIRLKRAQVEYSAIHLQGEIL